MWSSYFDDFFSVTDADTSQHTDFAISALFRILGWRLSTDKLIPYDSLCKVLGVTFDSRLSGAGLSFVSNTEERIKELCDNLEEVIESRVLKRSDGEKLRGRLLFAAGQLFGRKAHNMIRLLSYHIQCGRRTLCDDTVEALTCLKNILSLNVPRKIVGKMSAHMHLYVDASYDGSVYSGIGGILYDSLGNVLSFFSETISDSLVRLIKCDGQVTIIQELEMLALLAAVETWRHMLSGFRVVAFTDSEAVRGSFLKTWTHNRPNHNILARIFELEESHNFPLWLERVPSQSNPADSLSRENLKCTRVEPTDLWKSSVPSLMNRD